MVPGKRAQPGVIGLGLEGSWTKLAPPDETTAAALDHFNLVRDLNPAMGGAWPQESHFAPPMLILDRRTGEPAGLVENHRLSGTVAVYSIYLDPGLGRPGFGVEATALYVSHLFDCGARLVTTEVLSFNTPVTGLLRKIRIEPQARLREHVFAAGRFWDLLVYSFDRREWLRALAPYRPILPGGGRAPAAIGGGAGRGSAAQ